MHFRREMKVIFPLCAVTSYFSWTVVHLSAENKNLLIRDNIVGLNTDMKQLIVI